MQYHCVGETRCLRRKDIIDTLYAALPTATVKFGCQLESIKLDPHTTKPIVRFIDGSSIIAKVVIGCEGDKSIIADFVRLKRIKMFPLCEVRGLTNYPYGHSFAHEFTSFKKDNILVGRIPIDNKLVYWFCTQPYILKDESIWKDPEVIQHNTLELLSNYPQEIQEMIKTTETKSLSSKRLRYRAPWDLITSTLSRGTVIVAGDAKHVMGPFLGQGGSAALEDAVVLARNMAQLGLDHVEDAFNQFVRQRRIRVIRVSLQTYLIGMLSSNPSRLKKYICILLIILLFRNQKSHMDYDCGAL
ncbi:putative FAD-binding domain, FAD/NAD(P)-binding domain superfamily [Helianthus anomalus]